MQKGAVLTPRLCIALPGRRRHPEWIIVTEFASGKQGQIRSKIRATYVEAFGIFWVEWKGDGYVWKQEADEMDDVRYRGVDDIRGMLWGSLILVSSICAWLTLNIVWQRQG